MGLEIHDPEGVEGEIRQLPGLGLLPVITTMQGEKVTRQVNFIFLRMRKLAKDMKYTWEKPARFRGCL